MVYVPPRVGLPSCAKLGGRYAPQTGPLLFNKI